MSFGSLRRALLAVCLSLTLLPAAANAAEPGLSILGYTNPAGHEPDWASDVLSGAPTGHKWVYMPVDWSQMQPQGPDDPLRQSGDKVVFDMDSRVAAYNAAGINVMGVISSAPAWSHPGSGDVATPPDDPATYANFAAWLARRYAGKVSAWQIWNEPDDNIFWTNGPQPDRYAPLLKAAYTAIKGTDPAATVVTGGLVGNDYPFLQQLYDRGAKSFFDAVGTHTSTACLTKGPDFYYRETDGRIGRFAFTGYREVHQQMALNGEDKPIFMEIGWSTSEKDCNVNNKKGPAGVSQADQAKFITQAFTCTDPYVKAMSVFSLQDATAADNRYDERMGLSNWDGSHKPGWDALKTAAALPGASDPNCGAKLDTDLPTATISVPDQYFSRFAVDGAASDPTTGVSKIELWVDGKRVEGTNQTGGKYHLDWFGSSKLKSGKHTVELRAYDEALNVGVASKVVEKLDASSGVRVALPQLTFASKKAKGRRISITARVQRAATGPFTEKPRGRLKIFFERKVGKRWKPYSRYTKGISHTARLLYTARKPGQWRVYARTVLDAPYKNVATQKFVYKLR